MKESLSYKVLITMQKRHRLKQNAVDRGESYEADNSHHYDGIGKRLSDLCNYGYAERKGDDEKGYLRYQVSDKGLCIKSFKDFYENTLKMKQYRASSKKTREESAVKKECKNYIEEGNGLVFSFDPSYSGVLPKQPRYKKLRHALVR